MQGVFLRLFCGFLMLIISFGCGKKSKGDNGLPAFVNTIATGSDSLDYAIKAISALKKDPPHSSMGLSSGSADHIWTMESQDLELLDCGNQGSAWDQSGLRMPVSAENFSETTFYCQFKSTRSTEQLMGSLKYYKSILCSVESAIGSVNFSEEGNQYSNQTITQSEACGWPETAGNQSLVANIVAYAMRSGDWQKRMTIKVPSLSLDLDLYFSVNAQVVALKVLDKWTKTHVNTPLNSGVKGAVFALDIPQATLRLEAIDTYASRRHRVYVRGELNQSNGLFSSVTESQGIIANFDDLSSGLYAEIATMIGSDTLGYLYSGYSYSGDTSKIPNTLPTISANSSRCSKNGGCQGISPLSFSASSDDLSFLTIGVVWDSRSGRRSVVESWLMASGLPVFSSVTKGVSL